uniref:UBP1-associated protein 2B-like n=1 Tax=Erigeron canadensis TaxID=72917 RepID=UPI001CB9CE8F|nr:UBP1-associated protein 2B-like [Erigeron canadensis]
MALPGFNVVSPLCIKGSPPLKKYGDIEEYTVVTDKVTGKAKGYGFVLFKNRKSASTSLKKTQKKIGSRMATCQLASAGPGGPSNNQNTATQNTIGRKIFLANVGSHVNPNALRSYFAKFGEIDEGPLGVDNATVKFKGFAMFVYKTAEGCKKALEEPNKVYDGCELQCKQAVDGQRGNKNAKNLPPAMSDNEIGNLSYGYDGLYAPQLMNPGAGVMVGQNPMLVSALNQNTMSSTPQSYGLSGSYGMNTVSPGMLAIYGSQLGLPGIGTYQTTQMGRSSSSTSDLATREHYGHESLASSFSSYRGR